MRLYKKKIFLGIVFSLFAIYAVHAVFFNSNDYGYGLIEDERFGELGFYDDSETQAEAKRMAQCPYDGPNLQDYHAFCDAPVFLEVECRLKSVPLKETEQENFLLDRSCQTAINRLFESGFFVPFDSKQNIDIEKFDNDNLKAKVVVFFKPPEHREEIGKYVDYERIIAIFSDFMSNKEFEVTYRDVLNVDVDERWGFTAVHEAFIKYTRNLK